MYAMLRLLCVLALFGQAHGYVDKTVYQYLVDNGYSEFVKLLNDVNLQTVLSGKGPFTIFAPTNTAIKNMDSTLAKTMNASLLQKKTVVQYHIADSFVVVPQVEGLKYIHTLALQNIEVLRIGSSLIINNGTRVDSPPYNDILCSNGVIQPIDSVLTPLIFDTDNLAAVLIEHEELFQEFLMGLLLTNQMQLMEAGKYTIFAPTNDAYGAAYKRLMGSHIPVDKRLELVKEILRYHIVPGERISGTLRNGEQLYTLHGTPINITVGPSGTMVNNALIVAADIGASNGIIQGINHILFPMDMLDELKKLYAQYYNGTNPFPR